jgi:uncharacterized protein (TIGR02266 family)
MTRRTPMNTRKYRRTTVRMLVDYQAMGGLHCDYATTLGAGGMFLQTELALRRGDLVKVRFRVPGNETLHELQAKVTWHHDAQPAENGEVRTPGVGLQFVDPKATNELARELEDYRP